MSESTFTVWETIVDTDERHEETLGYFWTEQSAQTAAKGSGWYGGNGRVRPVEAVKLGKKVYRVNEITLHNTKEEAIRAGHRSSGLAKLSQAEREALGIVLEE